MITHKEVIDMRGMGRFGGGFRGPMMRGPYRPYRGGWFPWFPMFGFGWGFRLLRFGFFLFVFFLLIVFLAR